MKYYIHTDNSYADIGGATLQRFEGTFRELLLHLNGVTESDEWDTDTTKTVRDLTDAELLDIFNNANGDGQNYTTVFEVEVDDRNPYGEKIVRVIG